MRRKPRRRHLRKRDQRRQSPRRPEAKAGIDWPSVERRHAARIVLVLVSGHHPTIHLPYGDRTPLRETRVARREMDQRVASRIAQRRHERRGERERSIGGTAPSGILLKIEPRMVKMRPRPQPRHEIRDHARAWNAQAQNAATQRSALARATPDEPSEKRRYDNKRQERHHKRRPCQSRRPRVIENMPIHDAPILPHPIGSVNACGYHLSVFLA